MSLDLQLRQSPMVEHCCARTENCRPASQTGDQISAPGGYVGGDPISLFRIRSSAANDAQRPYSTGAHTVPIRQLVIKIRVDQIHNSLKFRCERNKDPPSDPNYTVALRCAEPTAYET